MTVVFEFVAWWLATLGVWMASLSAWSAHDFVVAAACAVPAAATGVLARRAVEGSWRADRRVLAWAVRFPAAVVSDAVRVLALPLRRGRGEFRTVTLAGADQPGTRAVAALLLSATPGSYVVSTDPETGTALIHAIGPASGLERAMSS